MDKLPVIVDVHAHILPGVDDGSGSMEESLEMLEMAASQGIGAVIATPHYSHRRGITGYHELIQELRQRVQQKLPGFRLYLGQETYYKEELLDDLENGRALSLNGSRYILVEFDPSVTYQNLYRGIRQLTSAGYVPVVAHMERYRCLREERNLQDLRRSGCLLQMNFDSLNGSVFQAETRWCRRQITQGHIHLMGTDMHRIDWREPKIQDSLKWLQTHLDEETLRRLLRTNAVKVLRNEPIGEIQKQG